MFNAGSIVGRLNLDTSGFAGGFVQANALMRVFPETLQNFMASPLLGLIGIARSAAGALKEMLGISLSNGFKLAVDAEQAGVAFEVMLGSAERGQKALKDLSDFAAATPFELPELVGAGRKLLAFNVTAEQLIPSLTRIGDISAGIGAPIGEIAELFGKAKVQGRLMMEDINQLTGRGIPIIQELAKQFKVAESAVRGLVEKGSVNFDNLDKAFTSLTSSGGRFAGLMEKQSQTLGGLWSTLKDTVGQAMRSIAETLISGFDLKGVVRGMADAVGQIMEFLRPIGALVWDVMGGAWEAVKPVVGAVFEAIKVGWGVAWPLLQGLGGVVKEIGGLFGGVAGVILTVLKPALELLDKILRPIVDALKFVLESAGKAVSMLNPLNWFGGRTAAGAAPASSSSTAAPTAAAGGTTVNVAKVEVAAPNLNAATSELAGKILPPLREQVERSRRQYEAQVQSALVMKAL